MKLLVSLVTFFLILSVDTNSQMKIPPDFKRVGKESKDNTYGKYIKGKVQLIKEMFYGAEPSDKKVFDKDTDEYLKTNYRTSLVKKYTFKDGLYYGYGFNSSNNTYLFFVLDIEDVYKLSSTKNDKEFKDYSEWLLRELKNKGNISKK